MDDSELEQRTELILQALIGVRYLDWRKMRDEIDARYARISNNVTISQEQVEECIHTAT